MTSSAPGQISLTSQEASIRRPSRVRAYRRRSSTWSTGRPIRSTWSPTREPADPLTEATLYFICSEALANAAKYAAASTIAIDLRQTGTSLRLVVSDDGRGGARFTSRGGLRGLADRVEALGGTFRLESRPDAGTTIRVELRARAAATLP